MVLEAADVGVAATAIVLGAATITSNCPWLLLLLLLMLYLVNDLLEVYCHTCPLQISVVGGVVYQLCHFVEPQL